MEDAAILPWEPEHVLNVLTEDLNDVLSPHLDEEAEVQPGHLDSPEVTPLIDADLSSDPESFPLEVNNHLIFCLNQDTFLSEKMALKIIVLTCPNSGAFPSKLNQVVSDETLLPAIFTL